MEKFSTWRDKGTGISPFLPVDSTKPTIYKFVVCPLLLALKWPVFVLLYASTLIFPKAAIRAILSLLFSVNDIDVSVEGIRKSKKSEIYASQPDVGDVVISNFVSPLDILVHFLISKVNSVGSIAVLLPVKDELYLFSVWKALRICFVSSDTVPTLGTNVTGSLKTHTQSKLVVYFPEGTPTNNKAVMPLSPSTNKVLELSKSIKVAILRYYPGSIAVPIPYLGPKAYASKLMTGRGKSYVKVKIVPLENPSSKACQKAFTENGLSSVELSIREKEDFFKYYQDYKLEKITRK